MFKQRIIEQLIAAHAQERAQLHAALDTANERFAAERSEWADERRRLLNRIQSPQTAAYEAKEEPSGEVLHVPYDDDAEWDEYMEARAAGEVA